MRRILKRLVWLAAVSVLFYCIFNLFTGFSQVLLKQSIANQINSISQQLLEGADQSLQQSFPEGVIFANAIFALSILEAEANLSLSYKEAARLIDHSILQLLSDDNSQNYDKDLIPAYGAFYNGWTNVVLMNYRLSKSFKYSSIQNQVNSEYSTISERIVAAQNEGVHLLDTYHSSIWPADNLMCIASLDSSHHDLQQDWYRKIIDSSDNQLGLINHDGFQPEISRGSSLALATYATALFDPESARRQNSIFQKHYLLSILDIHFIKEYENDGELDVDSGPIIYGIGSVATIMNIKTQKTINNKQLRLTWGFLNMLGLPINFNGKKHYLFKQELMFDIFMLWTSVSLLD